MARHFRGLDALRGLAVAAVLAFHARFAGFQGGFLGVSLFFTVSGFLITSLVLREMVHGNVNLGAFWGRRARRLLPAAAAVIVLVVLASALGVFDVHRSAADGFFALVYAANWHQLAAGQSYAALFAAPSPLLHFWSLAIEEQYYLVFPLLCWWCARRRHPRAALTIALVGVLAVSVHAHLEAWSTNRMYYGTDVRIGEIALGALLALAVERWNVIESRPRWLRRSVAGLQIPVLVVVAAVVVTTSESSRWLYHGGLLAMGCCWTVLVLAAVLECGVVGLFGRLRALVWLGVISYGVYLVHWPLLLAVRPFHNATADATLALALSVVIAAVSYRYYEAPIRFGELSPRLRRNLVRIGAATLAAVSATAVVASTFVPAEAGVSFSVAGGPARSTAAAPPRALRVLVIGDSTAAVLGHGLVEYADEHKNIVVDSEGVNGCALSDARAQNMVREQEWASVPAKCRHWATRLAADVSFRPDVVLAVFGPAEIADLELGDHGPAGDVRRADVQASAAAEVARLRALFPRARFVWATAPLTFTGNQELPEGDWLINDPVRIGAWNRLVAEFAHDPHSSMLDLAAFFATAPGGWRNRSWRPDGAHLQGVALTRAAQWTVVQLKHIQHSA